MAVSADGVRWFLVNASPDLRAQIEGFPLLVMDAGRGTRIEAVLVTNADLDHVLGLFLLREAGGIAVHASPAVRETLSDRLHLKPILDAFGGIVWKGLTLEQQTLLDRSGRTAGLSCRAIFLPGRPPPYAPAAAEMGGHSVALQIIDEAGARLLVAPDVEEITPALEAAMRESDAVLLDGTFWSADELRAIKPGARTAREMGHIPISGKGGTLGLMQALPARYKGYMHINNTNPILMPGAPERAAVEKAGVTVTEDGWEFEL